MENISADTSISQDSALSLISDIHLDSVKDRGSYYFGKGNYQFKLVQKGKSYPMDYRFKCLLWRKERHVYFLLASLIELHEIWGKKNKLSPSDETLERYFIEEVIDNVKVFDRKL